MIRLLFVPPENTFVFKSNMIVHGKPLMANLKYLNCEATHSLLNNSHDLMMSAENDYRVTFLLNVQGLSHLELLDFEWECTNYEQFFGPCANITRDLDYAVRAHLAPFTELFSERFKLPINMAQIVLSQAVQKFRSLVEKNGIVTDH